MFSTVILVFATMLSPAVDVVGEAPVVRQLDLPSIIGESLAASRPHATPQQLRAEALKIQAELSSIVGEIGHGPADYERAKRLHRLLHRRYLENYRRDADGLIHLLETGEYNCLSTTLLYGLLARELGYDVLVLERPGHVLLALEFDDERIAVETTSPKGFDRTDGHEMERIIRVNASGRIRSSVERDPAVETREFPLEGMIGFAWLNSGWRELSAGRPLGAAERVDRARKFLPYLAETDDAQQILSRAFFVEYEQGSFAAAYRIASIELRVWPRSTTSRDRLLAAAMKRIEDAVDDDAPALAASIAMEVSRTVVPGRDVARFERRVWPVIAAGSVRLSDWALASACAERYARVEPDEVEVSRLTEWIDERLGASHAIPTAAICEPGRCGTTTARLGP